MCARFNISAECVLVKRFNVSHSLNTITMYTIFLAIIVLNIYAHFIFNALYCSHSYTNNKNSWQPQNQRVLVCDCLLNRFIIIFFFFLSSILFASNFAEQNE